MDCATRKALPRWLSNTLDASFCPLGRLLRNHLPAMVGALNEAIAKYGKLEIVNTPSRALLRKPCRAMDQGSQLSGPAWTTTLTKVDVKRSMPLGDFTNHLPVTDVRDRDFNNIIPLRCLQANAYRTAIERLWRSLKKEAVYQHELQDGLQAKRMIKDWIGFYNSERPHTALRKRPPNCALFDIERNQRAA